MPLIQDSSGNLVFECELLPDGVEQEVLSTGTVQPEFSCGCKVNDGS